MTARPWDAGVPGRLVKPFELSQRGPPQFAYFVISPEHSAGTPLVRAFHDWIMEEAKATSASQNGT
jgi:LysR family glycine cleavage system transcriptional activator